MPVNCICTIRICPPMPKRIPGSVQRKLLVFALLFLFWTPIAVGQVNANFTFTPDNECSPMEVTFTNTSTGSNLTYHWDFGDGQTDTVENPTHIFVADPGDGNQLFTVMLTVSSGDDSDSHDDDVTVIRPPSTSLTSLNQVEFAKCSPGNSFTLLLQNTSTTQNAQYHIDWGDGNQDTFVTFDDISYTYDDPDYYELIFTVTGDNGCVASEEYPVLFGESPGLDLSIPPGAQGCVPHQVNFPIDTEGAVGTTFSFWITLGQAGDVFWGPENFLPGEAVPPEITVDFDSSSCDDGQGIGYYFHGEATNRCGSADGLIGPVNIDQEPVAVIFASEPIVCVDTDITIFNQTIPPCGGNPNLTQYEWFVDGAFVGDDADYIVLSFDVPGYFEIRLEAEHPFIDCNDGYSEAIITIEVIDPGIPHTPDIQGDETVCQGEDGVTYSVVDPDSDNDYVWSAPAGVNIISGQGTDEILVNFAENIPLGTLTLTVKAENECFQGDEGSIVISVEPLPESPGNIEGLQHICFGIEVTVTYEVPLIDDANEYIWEVPPGASIVGNPPYTNIIQVHFPEDAQSGTLSVRGQNDCGQGPKKQLPITVDPIPADATGIDGDTEVCQGMEITFTAATINHAQEYIWVINNVEEVITPDRTLTVSFEQPGAATISVRGSNACGEGGSSDNKTVDVFSGPETDFGPQPHCFGKPAPFFPPGSGPDEDIPEWNWDFGDGYSSSLSDPIHIYDDIGIYTVTLTVTTDDNCRATYSDLIEVLDIPVSGFSASTETVFAGQVVQFTDESYMMHDTNQPAPFVHYNFGDGTDSNEPNPTKIYQDLGAYTVRQTVDVAGGMNDCPDESEMQLMVVLDIIIPNAFAPGGGGGAGTGGGTDSFGPSVSGFVGAGGVSPFTGDFEFMVFNRWGERIYFEKSSEPSWDGTIRGGQPAPAGVYVWRLKYDIDGTIMSKTGTVMLLR